MGFAALNPSYTLIAAVAEKSQGDPVSRSEQAQATTKSPPTAAMVCTATTSKPWLSRVR
jgi:hypothetical protein